MSGDKKYKCVNCGEPALALFKTYSPSVLKLTKCDNCNGVVDKYIEYDPVIIMIDLVLMSNEAQRHVIYNTKFKSYWKLFIVLLMLDSYGLWKNDSLFNIIVSSACQLQNNNTITVDLSGLSYDFLQSPAECVLETLNPDGRAITKEKKKDLITLLDFIPTVHHTFYMELKESSRAEPDLKNYLPKEIALPEGLKKNCPGWDLEDKTEENDLFLWERDFYIYFTGNITATAVFFLGLWLTTNIANVFTTVNKVTILQLFQTYSLGNTSNLFALPMLVWGTNETTVETRFMHYALVYLYTYFGCISLFTVLYGCKKSHMAILLVFCNIGKFVISFYTTPFIRKLAE